jgi:hypothetical protein
MVRYSLNGNDYPVNDRSNPVEVRRETMNLVRELLNSGQVRVGSLAPDGGAIEVWPITVDEAIDRINREWDELGHEPDMENVVAIFTRPGGRG